MANPRLIMEALLELLGRKKDAQEVPMNLPESPRTLPGNRANVEHPDFDPGDFEVPGDFDRGMALTDPSDLSPRDLEEIQGLVSPLPAANLNNPGVNVLVQTIEGQISRTGKANPELLRMLTERDPAMARRIRESMDRQAQQARGAPPAKKLTEEEREYIDLERFDDEDFKY
jgi:hypothetical protein